MDPKLIILAVLAGVLVVAYACGLTYHLARRDMLDPEDALLLVESNVQLHETVAKLTAMLAEQQQRINQQAEWTAAALATMHQGRADDMAAVAEKLEELTKPAAVARLALGPAPAIDLTGDSMTDSGASLFDALVSETHMVPLVGDLTMSTYTRTEAAELVEMLHAGAGR